MPCRFGFHDWSAWVEQHPVSVRANRKGVIIEVTQHSEARACVRCVKIQIRAKDAGAAAQNNLHRRHLVKII
jgi:hypothetical protein